MSAPPSPSPAGNQDEAPQQSEHLNIKVTDNNNEVFFKIKRTTQLKKLMDAFCDRQGKSFSTVRFLFDGTRVNPTDNPEMVSRIRSCMAGSRSLHTGRATRSRLAEDANAPKLPACSTTALYDRDENDYARK
jgi:hypothetical protein